MTESTKQALEEWFKIYDVDGSGKVDISELREVIKAFYAWKQEVVDDAKIDADAQVRIFTHLLTYLLVYLSRSLLSKSSLKYPKMSKIDLHVSYFGKYTHFCLP